MIPKASCAGDIHLVATLYRLSLPRFDSWSRYSSSHRLGGS